MGDTRGVSIRVMVFNNTFHSISVILWERQKTAGDLLWCTVGHTYSMLVLQLEAFILLESCQFLFSF